MAQRVYCAGALFTPAERGEMEAIEAALAGAGYDTFLPHRDGLEFARLVPVLVDRGLSPEAAEDALARAIFALDTFEVGRADAVVMNLNGRVPDEGAVAEAAIAWARGIPVVFYKDDPRAFIGGADNPLVAGLGGFASVERVEAIPQAVADALASAGPATALADLGPRIAEASGRTADLDRIADALLKHLDPRPVA